MVMMQATMCSIDTSLKTQERMKRIEFAVDQCSHAMFTYYPKADSFQVARSEMLVKNILLSFHQGFGYYIPLEMTLTHHNDCRSYEARLASHQQFRDALTELLHTILGVKPVWSEPEQNGGRMIMYP
jgi:hypothetical protein